MWQWFNEQSCVESRLTFSTDMVLNMQIVEYDIWDYLSNKCAKLDFTYIRGY